MAGKDDEQEIPFRWSLFLPAPGDAASMRMLKYAVIGMGIILILGFMVIAARIVYLTTRIDASLPPGSAVALVRSTALITCFASKRGSSTISPPVKTVRLSTHVLANT